MKESERRDLLPREADVKTEWIQMQENKFLSSAHLNFSPSIRDSRRILHFESYISNLTS